MGGAASAAAAQQGVGRAEPEASAARLVESLSPQFAGIGQRPFGGEDGGEAHAPHVEQRQQVGAPGGDDVGAAEVDSVGPFARA